MYRSVTLSEIFSSTYSGGLNKYNESYDKNGKARFVAKIGIGLIEFMVSSIFLCYGIIFSECVNIQYYTVENGLWTTILYTSAWNITGPWSRYICKYSENKYVIFRYIIAIATVLLFTGLIIPGQVLSFGVFGGIFSNLIYTQLKLTAIENFDMDSKVFEGNIQVARALTLLIMPHFMLLLVTYYATYQVKLIFATFLLNIFPAALIIKPQNNKQKYAEISRYQTLPAFSSQMREMMSFTNSVNLSDPQKSESSSVDEEEEQKEMLPTPEDESIYDTLFANDQLMQLTYLTPLTVETYYKNAGVNILPQIPEENEVDENETDTMTSRELSKVTAKLKEINQQEKVILHNEIRREEANLNINKENETSNDILSIKELVANNFLDGPERIQNIEYIPNYNEGNTHFLRDLKTIKTNFCCCSPYRKFIWRRRFRVISDFFLDNFIKPLFVSLKDLHFYPIIISKVVTSVTSTIYITLAPYVASKRSEDFQPEDATFLLSYMAFSWCLFLVLLPLVINFNHGKIRVTFIFGLLLTGTSIILISREMTNDIITISCLLFGFGYGATSFTENMVYKSFVGLRKWIKIKETLETTSALFVILTYYIIYHFKLNLRILLSFAFTSYYINAILWIAAPVFKSVIIIFKQYCRKKSQRNNFL